MASVVIGDGNDNVGAVVSIFIVAVLLEPGPAPLLGGLALSVAVQLTLLVPSLETVRVPLALVVPVPVTPLSTAPEQLIDATFEGSVAVTVPVTGEVLNQPLLPLGVGKVTVTTGAVMSETVIAKVTPLPDPTVFAVGVLLSFPGFSSAVKA